jgi:hypothetical protein
MKREKIESPGSDMEMVRGRFEEWRRTRKSGCKIPEELWMEAVKLADVYSLSRICESLRVEFNHLKRRVEGHGALPAGPAPASPGFIEVGLARMGPQSECTIEAERSDGSRMRVSVRGAVDPRLIEMLGTLWSRP